MERKFERLVHEASKIDGRLVLKNPRWFRGMLQQTPDCVVMITVERKKRSRSKEQMGYYWAVVLPEIAGHTGHSVEELHDIFKAKYLKRKRRWRGTSIVVLASTSDLTSNEMAEYITNVILEANELGIEVPPADPAYQWR